MDPHSDLHTLSNTFGDIASILVWCVDTQGIASISCQGVHVAGIKALVCPHDPMVDHQTLELLMTCTNAVICSQIRSSAYLWKFRLVTCTLEACNGNCLSDNVVELL